MGGLVYFGRMLDKLRLKARGELPSDYNVGTRDWYFFDARCARFLGVRFADLRKQALRGGTDLQLLRWCFKNGRTRTKEEIDIWNTFMMKRGWHDESSGGLEEAKRESGFGDREDILTWFDLFDADESRHKTRP